MHKIIEIKVFVSCPSDVTTEKNMVKAVCETINNTLSSTESPFRLKTLDFRDIFASISGRAQEEINIRFSDYDIYIGILWMRFGTPTGASDPNTDKLYESGTEEEFRIAQKRYKDGEKVKMYVFVKEPCGPKGLAATEQLLKVEKFKEEVQALGWVNSFPNKTESIEFNNSIHQILNEWVRKVEKKERVAKKKKYLDKQTSPLKLEFKEVAKFITKAPEFITAIPRTLSPFNTGSDPFLKYLEKNEEKNLTDLVTEKKHVVVLGNAGSGKTTELGNLAQFYAKKNTPFVPVYQRLNTYIDQPIEDYLPAGWNDVPESICLIILDGLDEVQPTNFNTAVRQILNFSDKYPEVRVVVSCRTNFYDFPDASSGGTLSGYDVYFIDDIKGDNISGYAEKIYNIDSIAFVKDAHHEGLSDLIQQPFFLNILLSQYKERGNLRISKAELLERFLSQRIELDQAHFQLTVPLKEKKPYIIQLLQKVALTMEYLGRNYLFFDELMTLLPDAKDINLIKFSTAFRNFESEPDKWGFEHNNIQEFLAASALTHLAVKEIKACLSFDNKRIKPSWINTLFFLMSIVKDEKREELINWILEIDAEVLVKIEPDKVDAETRFQIFKEIFEYYKLQAVWIRSNKFSLRELAIFVPAESGNKYLLKELGNTSNLRIVRMNAVLILSSQKLYGDQLVKTKHALLNFTENNPDDQHIFQTVTGALTSLDVVDRVLIDQLLDIFGNRMNQYIRTGFYQMIGKSGLTDHYIDYIIEGLSVFNEDIDRESVNLVDESFWIKELLTGQLNYNSLIKVFSSFENPDDRRIVGYHDKPEILKSLIEKAIIIYNTHKDIFNVVLNVYYKYRKFSEESYLDIIAGFFKSTSTDLAVFKNVFFHKEIGAYEKSLLYKFILSKQAIDFIINEHDARNLTNKDMLDFYHNINWSVIRRHKESELTYLTKRLNETTHLLKNNIQIDYQKLRQERTKENITLYFSIPKFEDVIKKFFDELEVEYVDWDLLWQKNRYDDVEEDCLPEAVFDLLMDFTRDKNKTNLKKVLKTTAKTDSFHDYLFERLKDKITNHPDLELSSEQMSMLSAWVKDRANKADVLNAIQVSVLDPHSFSYNIVVMTLWFYISKYKIKIKEDKLLDFTVYHDLINNQETGLDFEVIEQLAGQNKVKERVLINLEKGIDYDSSWKNNASYALENNITAANSIILGNLKDTSKAVNERISVMKLYAAKTKDYYGLIKLLGETRTVEFRWNIIDILIAQDSLSKEAQSYLTQILNSGSELLTEKFNASKYLVKMGNITGTEYYLQYLIDKKNQSFDYYYQSAYLRSIKDIRFISPLIELLIIGNQPKMQVDDFNRLDSCASDALYNLALISEENLQAVKVALKKFIIDYKDTVPNINFYYPMIDRMEYHFYLAKSQTVNIDDAIKEIERIGYK